MGYNDWNYEKGFRVMNNFVYYGDLGFLGKELECFDRGFYTDNLARILTDPANVANVIGLQPRPG